MKHEKFKVFSTREQADDFLADGEINAKSISFMTHDDAQFLVIGYTESKKTHHYRLEEEIIENFHMIGLEGAMKEAEKLAEKHNGVICQDMHIEDGSLAIMFLVATEHK